MPRQSLAPSSFLAMRAESLRRRGWGRASGNAWLTLMACAGLKVLLPASLRDVLRPLLAVAPLLPLMAKDLAHLPDALARSRNAIAAIAGCERLSIPMAEWCARHGIDPRAALCASPFDKPNTVLMLAPGADVRLRHMGRARSGLACVFLYLDRPDTLIAAVQQPLAAA